MWFIDVDHEVEQETSAPPPKKHPGSAPVSKLFKKAQEIKWGLFILDLNPFDLGGNYMTPARTQAGATL